MYFPLRVVWMGPCLLFSIACQPSSLSADKKGDAAAADTAAFDGAGVDALSSCNVDCGVTSCPGVDGGVCQPGHLYCGSSCVPCPSLSTTILHKCAEGVCVSDYCARGYALCPTGCCQQQLEQVGGTDVSTSVHDLVVQGLVPTLFYKNSQATLVASTKNGSGWSTETIAEGTRSTDTFAVAVDSSGFFHVVFHGWAAGTVNYATNKSGSWQVELIYTTSILILSGLDIAVDGYDSPHIAFYFSGGGSDYHLRHYYIDSGGAWVHDSPSSTDTGRTWSSPHMAFDSLGRLYIVYHPSGLNLFVGDNGQWQSQQVTTDGVSGARIAIDSNDTVHLTYSRQGDFYHAQQTATGWQEQLIEGGSHTGLSNSLLLDSRDRPHVVFCSSCSADTNNSRRWDNIHYAWRFQDQWHSIPIVTEGSVMVAAMALDQIDLPHFMYFLTIGAETSLNYVQTVTR